MKKTIATGKKESNSHRGQTTIEYLLLVVTSVLLVSIIAYFVKTRVL